jgi:hypothetical protein
VWTLSPSFLDMRSVTTAWECTRRGIAVLPANPCDPLQRPANYPRIWLLPSYLGLGESSTVPLAVLMAVAFFAAALVVIPSSAGFVEGSVFGAALCSPSVMLGVERGNVDLFVFAVVVASILLLHRRGRVGATSPVLLLFAAILKLFPILAAVTLARSGGRRARIVFGTVVLAFGAYALATLGTIREIRRTVPQASNYAYGIKPFDHWTHDLFGAHGIHLSGRAWGWLLVGLTVVIAALIQTQLRQWLEVVSHERASARDLDLLVAGAAIYVGTFCLFQSFEYRLVFLLLTIPQLFRWTRGGHVLGMTGLLLVLLTLWLGSPWSGVPVVDSVLDHWMSLTSRAGSDGGAPLSAAASAQVGLAVVLLTLLVAAMPRLSISRARGLLTGRR